MTNTRYFTVMLVVLMLITSAATAQENIWDLQAVDSVGLGTHPKVGADPLIENQVVIEGISLAATGELDVPVADGSWKWFSVWVQAEDGRGGIQCFTGPWSIGIWELWNVQAGDRVRITGWVANYNGKVFINDRHSSALMWDLEILSAGEMPQPELIPSIAACNYFEQTRASGGEYYQTRWVRLNDVTIDSGMWGSGQELVLDDSSGTVHMKLADNGDFDDFDTPCGTFDVIGVFDQEDEVAPYHDHYRIWVKRMEHIIPAVTIERAVKLEWQSTAGMLYQVYGSDDMQTWQTVGDSITGDGTLMQLYQDAETAGNKFYKIEQSQP